MTEFWVRHPWLAWLFFGGEVSIFLKFLALKNFHKWEIVNSHYVSTAHDSNNTGWWQWHLSSPWTKCSSLCSSPALLSGAVLLQLLQCLQYTSLSYIHEIISYILYLFFLRQVLMCSRLSLNLLYSRQQPWTFNPPASNSQGLGLQVCTTMSGLWNTGDQTLILTQASITCSHHLQFSEQASGLCLSLHE